MAQRRLLVVLLIVGLGVVLAGCEGLAGAPAPQDPASAIGGVDINDPEVGGGIGFPDAAPGDDALPDTSPRLSGTAAAPTAAAPAPTASPLPSPTALPPTPEAPAEEAAPAESPTSEPTAAPATDDSAAEGETAAGEPDAPVDEASEDGETEAVAESERPATHIVAPGENLYRIGLQYGVDWLALAQFNGLTNANQITVGQELRIPPADGETEAEGEASAPEAPGDEPPADEAAEEAATDPPPDAEEATAAAEPTPPPQPQAPTPSPLTETTHTVAPGDTVYRLSQRYGVSWVQIAEANGLITPNQIFIGQVLKIPVSQPGTAPEFVHNVRPGESLFRIALQYGLPLAALVEANGLQPPYVIYPGQTLLIPGVTEPAP